MSHRFGASSAVFDDGNQVSCAGLVPVMTVDTVFIATPGAAPIYPWIEANRADAHQDVRPMSSRLGAQPMLVGR